ncbi:MAG: MFS transporter [Verrucomicrobia bacterium]|nr:MFS transporter [Verrucomicrobiota bacterium]
MQQTSIPGGQAAAPESGAAVAARVRRKVYARVVLPLFITSILAYVDRVNLSYAALTMNEDLGFTAGVFGLGAGIFFAGYVLFEIPGALIAERYSPKWWLGRIMITWGIVSCLMALVRTPWQFYTLRFLLGAAEASLYPVLYASCIPRWFEARDRPRAIAVMLASLQLSIIIGAPLSSWLLGVPLFGLKGWQGLFILEGIPAALFAFVLVAWLPDSPREARWLTPGERQYLLGALDREIAAKAAARRYTVGEALADREVLKLGIIYFLWITGFWGFGYWMPTVLKSASGWSNLAVGWVIVIPMCLSLGVMLWIGDHSSKTGEKRWHGAIGTFIGAAGLWFGTLTDRPVLAFLCLCLAAIGVYAPFGVWWSYPTTFLSGPAAAGAIGLINSSGNIGGFVGPYLTGFLKDWTGSYTSAWLYLALSLTCAGLLMLTLRRNLPTDHVSGPRCPTPLPGAHGEFRLRENLGSGLSWPDRPGMAAAFPGKAPLFSP